MQVDLILMPGVLLIEDFFQSHMWKIELIYF